MNFFQPHSFLHDNVFSLNGSCYCYYMGRFYLIKGIESWADQTNEKLDDIFWKIFWILSPRIVQLSTRLKIKKLLLGIPLSAARFIQWRLLEEKKNYSWTKQSSSLSLNILLWNHHHSYLYNIIFLMCFFDVPYCDVE